MSQSSAGSDTIKFNVGGETFEVLEHIVRAKPDTLLCTLLDDPSQVAARRGQENDTPIFVQANAKLFPFILDWYRFGSILIPASIGLEQIKRECAFFQLPDEVRIKRDREQSTANAVSSTWVKMRKIKDEVERRRAKFVKAKLALESVMLYEALMEQALRTRGSSEPVWQADLRLDLMKEILNGSGPGYDHPPSGFSDIIAKVKEHAAADGWLLEMVQLYDRTPNGPNKDMQFMTESELQQALRTPRLSPVQQRNLQAILHCGPCHVHRVTLQPSPDQDKPQQRGSANVQETSQAMD